MRPIPINYLFVFGVGPSVLSCKSNVEPVAIPCSLSHMANPLSVCLENGTERAMTAFCSAPKQQLHQSAPFFSGNGRVPRHVGNVLHPKNHPRLLLICLRIMGLPHRGHSVRSGTSGAGFGVAAGRLGAVGGWFGVGISAVVGGFRLEPRLRGTEYGVSCNSSLELSCSGCIRGSGSESERATLEDTVVQRWMPRSRSRASQAKSFQDSRFVP